MRRKKWIPDEQRRVRELCNSQHLMWYRIKKSRSITQLYHPHTYHAPPHYCTPKSHILELNDGAFTLNGVKVAIIGR